MSKSTTLEKIILAVLIFGIIIYFIYSCVQSNRGFVFDATPILNIEGATVDVGKTTVEELTNNGYYIGYTEDTYPGMYIVSQLDEEVEAKTHITNTLLADEEKVLANAYLSNTKTKNVNVKDTTISYVTVDLKENYVTVTYKDKTLNDMIYDESDDFFGGFEAYGDNKIIKKIRANGNRYVVVMEFDQETKKINSVTVALYEQFEKSN